MPRLSRHRRRLDTVTRAPKGRRALLGGAVLALFALAVTLAYIKPNPFSSDREVRVVFADASGIGKVGMEVRMAGTQVGEIVGAKRQGNAAVVTLKLKPEAGTIHRDARAALRPRLAFEGTAFIDLDPGSDSAPALPEDGQLGRSRTRSYVALDEALRVARPGTREALKSDARDLARTLGPQTQDGLRRTLAQAPALTRDLGTAARAARGVRTGALAGVVRGFGETSEAVLAQEESVGPLLRGSDRTLAALGTDGGVPLDATLRGLPSTLAKLDTGGRALTRIVDRAQPLSRDLVPAARELDPALREVRPLLREATPVLERTRPFVGDLRTAVREGGAAAAPTRDLLGDLQPTVDILNDSLLPTLAKPTGLGVPAYLQFINLFAGGGGASRPYLTGAQKGHFMRFGARFFTGIGLPLPPCTLLQQVRPELVGLLSGQGLCTP